MTDNTFRADTLDDLMNALPVFFGFVPRECVVGVAVTGPRCRFGFRLRHDLPPRGQESALAADLAPHFTRNRGDGVFVFALSADVERARDMALALRDALPERRRRLTVWADDERVWADVPDHPQDGEPYALSDHHEARVRAVADGQVILPDRSDLAAEVAGPTGEREVWLELAHDDALARFMARATKAGPEGFFESERREVAALVDRTLAGERLTDGDLVELAVRVTPRGVRDASWWRIDRQNARPMYALWASVARVAVGDFAPAALCLAAFAAWQWGDGARALTALERALQIEPQYKMGCLLQEALQMGLHPDSWSQIDQPA